LEEWFTAIYAQIESLKANKYIAKNASTIIQKERDIASKDLKMLKHFHQNRLSTNLLNQSVQSMLLEYVNDPFISELLLGITKYMSLIE
jgi:ABC-type transporter MlaC component